MKIPDGMIFEYIPQRASIELKPTELIMCKHCKHCEYDAEFGLLCAIWNYSKTESDGWCYKGENECGYEVTYETFNG